MIKEPFSLNAEISVLGGILIDKEAIDIVEPLLSAGDFHHSAHKEIYTAMLFLHNKKIVIDLVTLGDHLKEIGRLGAIGGETYLCEISDSVASTANISHYIELIKKKSRLRNIIDQARMIAIQASESNADPSTIPTQLAIEVEHKADINQVSSVIHQLNRNIEAGYPGFFPCYDLLARTIRKITPGHLWVVGGYTSIGKTAWAVDFICRLYRHEIENPGVAIFSTEMSCEQYLLRMLSNHTLIPGWAITENKMKDSQYAPLINAQVFFSERNLYLYDRLYKIEDIERTARLLKKTSGLDIIVIDYLQNMWGEGSIYERMSRLAPLLQYLAKDLSITVIALSQVSNQFQREKGSGGVFGFKGAGEIAASADLGIELERDKNIPERMIFKISKNRHGRIGEGVLEYVHGFVKLNEIIEDNK